MAIINTVTMLKASSRIESSKRNGKLGATRKNKSQHHRGFQTALAALTMFAAASVSNARDALTDSLALTYSDSTGSIPYRLFQPTGFDIAETKFPIVLFLHGSGERGTNNKAQVRSHVQGLIDRTETGSSAAYLIAPQAPTGGGWSDQPLQLTLDLVESFAATNNVDASRIYITGLSMGGFGTFAALENRASLFAAAVPMSGGGDPAFALTYAQTPIWAFHGANDRPVPVRYSQDTIAAIQNVGGEHERYTELAGKGHAIWSPIYKGSAYDYDTDFTGTYAVDGSDDIYSWMFAQQIPEPTTAALILCAIALVGGRSLVRRMAESPKF